MAFAEIKTVKKFVETVEPVETFRVTLSKEEAAVLLVLAGNVSGDPHQTGRKETSAIYYALKKAGVTLDYKLNDRVTGSFHFASATAAPRFRF